MGNKLQMANELLSHFLSQPEPRLGSEDLYAALRTLPSGVDADLLLAVMAQIPVVESFAHVLPTEYRSTLLASLALRREKYSYLFDAQSKAIEVGLAGLARGELSEDEYREVVQFLHKVQTLTFAPESAWLQAHCPLAFSRIAVQLIPSANQDPWLINGYVSPQVRLEFTMSVKMYACVVYSLATSPVGAEHSALVGHLRGWLDRPEAPPPAMSEKQRRKLMARGSTHGPAANMSPKEFWASHAAANLGVKLAGRSPLEALREWVGTG